jgi:hypothetical protein
MPTGLKSSPFKGRNITIYIPTVGRFYCPESHCNA